MLEKLKAKIKANEIKAKKPPQPAGLAPLDLGYFIYNQSPLPLPAFKDCQLLLGRRALLSALPAKSRFLEIAVAYGDFSQMILDTSQPAELVLLNPSRPTLNHAGHHAEFFSLDLFAKANMPPEDYLCQKFAPHPHVFLLKGGIPHVMDLFEDGYFDMIYMGSQGPQGMTETNFAKLARKVKPQGIIVMEDFFGAEIHPWLHFGFNAYPPKYLVLKENGAFDLAVTRRAT